MRWKPLLISSALSLSLLFGQAGVAAAEETDTNAETLLELYQLLVGSHYTHPDQDKVLQGAIKGMLEVLQDPFSSYMTPEEYAEFVQSLDNRYAGIGAVLNAAKSGEVLITEVYDGSPAKKSGLQAGDRILAVDGQAVTGKSAESVAALARGKAGTETVLTIARGSETREVKVVREAISLPTVTSKDLGKGVGYVRILTFGGDTSREFFAAYEQVAATSPNGIVLDLRGNGGGSVLPALEIADHFLTAGNLLVVHDGDGGSQAISADELGTEEMPLVVLVDQHTASASEMLAGALQVNQRAALIGTQTYGKGTMQEPFTLPNGGVLKLSIDAWELGDGTSVQKVGLAPDIRLTSDSVMVNAGMQYLLPERVQTLTLQKQGGIGGLNGNRLIDVPALYREGGREYLPLRYVVEAFGSEVRWVAKTNSVEFTLEGQAVRIELGTGSVFLDNRDVGLNGQVRLRNGVSYLSTDALNKILNGGVKVEGSAVTLQVD